MTSGGGKLTHLRNHERDMQAMRLRIAGESYPAIAQQLGFNSKQAAFKAVNSLLKRQESEEVEEMRKIEGMRLDADYMAMNNAAKIGEPSVIAVRTRISERRSRLFGLDAPTKQEVTGADGGPIMVVVDF